MNDSSFTPAFVLFSMVIATALASLELLWLKRPFQFAGSWWAIALLGFINVLFIFLLAPNANSYLFLFVVPVPIIPLAYVLLKRLAYLGVKHILAVPVYGPWKLAFLSLFSHAFVIAIAFGLFLHINPTLENVQQAIRDKKNGLLDLMLWISVKSEPNMTILVNEALTDRNDDAVRRLIRRGPDPRQEYRMREAPRDTQWRMTKWMLDEGVAPDDFGEMRQSPPFVDIAVGHSIADLEYCLKKGFEPKKYPGVIGATISEHPLMKDHVLLPDEVEALKEKIILLLNHGADINGVGSEGFPAIFILLTLKSEMPSVLALLIEKGADINTRSPSPLFPDNSEELPKGLTPLMLAVADKDAQYVALLVKSGADKTIRDSKGLSVLDYAKKTHADEAMMRLLQ